MKFSAEIDIMPLKALLDPQGKAVESSLKNIDLGGLSQVRIGKHISTEIEANSEEAAKEMAESACKKLLANEIMESFTIVIKTI
ncbi:MAG: phosphoribosylformylglycinamidine synthase subunit PurS [Flavobacteriales bacterium]|nr:phosphoribosylformylglycinamidine synthase subunit PurS [Flavobacteriales bacterium]